MSGHGSRRLLLGSATLATLGLFTRPAAILAALLAVYVLGIPNFYFKIGAQARRGTAPSSRESRALRACPPPEKKGLLKPSTNKSQLTMDMQASEAWENPKRRYTVAGLIG